MGLFTKIKEGLSKTKQGVMGQVDGLFKSFRKIDEDFFEELEEILVMGDVGIGATEKILDELRARIKASGKKDSEEVKEMLKDILCEITGEEAVPLQIGTKPSVILVLGVNGVGKTTTIAKLAYNLKAEGKQVILAAADTFRAAAIDQLVFWAEKADVGIVKHTEGSDPAAVVFDTIAAAKARGADVIICDTAGRLHNKKNLMDELGKINRIISRELPDADKEILLVVDGTTGQNGIQQAKEFRGVADVTGIVLTKLDGTAKGGVVISIKNELDIPVKYIGVGEKIDDLQVFEGRQFIDALFS